MAKKLKARNPQVKKSGPECVLHEGTLMEFVVEEARWECPEPGCTQKAWPEAEVANGRPIVGKGAVEVVLMNDDKTGKPHAFLRAMDNNVMIDVTEHLNTFPTIGRTAMVTLAGMAYTDMRTMG